MITAVYERTERGPTVTSAARGPFIWKRATRAQNMLLQAVTLGLGGVPVGAFQDDQVQKALSLPANTSRSI